MTKQYDLLMRLLIIGDSGVGKTCLLCRYVDGSFFPNYAATIGIDFKVKDLTVDSKRVRTQIWDTAGQERFDTITKQYYRRAQGILLVYDISNMKTFISLNKWISFAKQYARSNAQVMVVGNKTDLDEWRAVTREQGYRFAQQNNYSFFETSAYAETGHLEEVFRDLVTRIMINHPPELMSQSSQDSNPTSDCESEENERGFSLADRAVGKCCSIV
uniref:Uncharacterized protein n=1 Tax=Plectus sambesii TaxID=2011161 RepID=A0A914VPE3_9BILA